MCLVAICMSSLEKVSLDLLPIFGLSFFFFFFFFMILSHMSCLQILETLPLLVENICKYFLPFYGFSFHFFFLCFPLLCKSFFVFRSLLFIFGFIFIVLGDESEKIL